MEHPIPRGIETHAAVLAGFEEVAETTIIDEVPVNMEMTDESSSQILVPYRYYVESITENAVDGITESNWDRLGPFLSMATANRVVEEMKDRTQQTAIFSNEALEYDECIDEEGMKTLWVSSPGHSVEIRVDRMSIVYTGWPIQVTSTLIATGQIISKNEIVAKTLDAANKAAGARWLEIKTSHLDDGPVGRYQYKLEADVLKRDLARMRDQQVCFDREFPPGDLDQVRVWVGSWR